MYIESVVEFLEALPRAQRSLDGSQITVDCPWCDGEESSRPHLSIKLDVEPDEPMLYRCWRAGCGKKGVVNTDLLRMLGAIDPGTLNDLRVHNASAAPLKEKQFIVRDARDYELVNVPTGNNLTKLNYVRNRLGVNIGFDDLKRLKIQLSILDLLRVNDIRTLAAPKSKLRSLDVRCIGFVSMYNDYIICRDMNPASPKDRYYNYRIAGTADKKDLKIYCLPTTIDLLDPHSANINVAEGVFSILGAYFHTDLGRDRPNSIFAANCGAQYDATILQICKRNGLVKVRINVFSDSEVGMGFYEKLYRSLRRRLDIRSLRVIYNTKDEDFGVPGDRVKIDVASIV